MNESEYKSRAVKQINAEGHYARRFEDKFLVGFPDMMVIHKDCDKVFFIEAKVITAESYGPRTRQYIELERLSFNGVGVPLIMGFWNEDIYLSRLVVRATMSTSAVKPKHESIADFIRRFYLEGGAFVRRS